MILFSFHFINLMNRKYKRTRYGNFDHRHVIQYTRINSRLKYIAFWFTLCIGWYVDRENAINENGKFWYFKNILSFTQIYLLTCFFSILNCKIFFSGLPIHFLLSELKGIGQEEKMDILVDHQSYLDKQFFINTAEKVSLSILIILCIFMQ